MYQTCGDYAGVSEHNRNKTPLCDACKLARRQYMRRRRTDDKIRVAERTLNAARSRALWKLADRHRTEFDNLMKAEVITTAVTAKECGLHEDSQI